MKKGLKVIGLVLAMILIAGCMDAKVKMGINKDKSVDTEMSIKMDLVKYMKVVFEMMETPKTESEIREYLKENKDDIDTDELFSEEDKKQIEDAGYSVDMKMDEQNYIYTIEIKKHIDNIDQISTTEEITTNLENVFEEKETKFFTKTANDTYKANIIFDTEDEDEEMSMEEMKEYITFNYQVTLPNSAISNNADSVSNDQKTLTWDLMAKTNATYEFSFPKEEAKPSTKDDTKKDNILSIGLIVGGSATLIIATAAYIISKKKN